MSTYRVGTSKVISARPEHVYRLVLDMNEHKMFLPKEFEKLEILKGGVGPGTVVRVHMKVMGAKAVHTLTLSEPEPGRVIREYGPESGVDTLWTFTPVDGGAHTHLNVETEFQVKPGFVGFLERLLNPRIVRGLYGRELDLLDAYAQKTQEKGRIVS